MAAQRKDFDLEYSVPKRDLKEKTKHRGPEVIMLREIPLDTLH